MRFRGALMEVTVVVSSGTCSRSGESMRGIGRHWPKCIGCYLPLAVVLVVVVVVLAVVVAVVVVAATRKSKNKCNVETMNA